MTGPFSDTVTAEDLSLSKKAKGDALVFFSMRARVTKKEFSVTRARIEKKNAQAPCGVDKWPEGEIGMPTKQRDALADAIRDTLISPNVSDCNGEPANVVDAIVDLARSGSWVANAIMPSGASPGQDETGGSVASLTEAVMGVTAGLVKIASAIHDLADTVRESGPSGTGQT